MELEQHLKNIQYYGYTNIKNGIEKSTAKTLLELTESHYANLSDISYSGVPSRDKSDRIIYNLPGKNIAFLRAIFNEKIHQILMPLLNDQYYRFLPSKVPNYI